MVDAVRRTLTRYQHIIPKTRTQYRIDRQHPQVVITMRSHCWREGRYIRYRAHFPVELELRKGIKDTGGVRNGAQRGGVGSSNHGMIVVHGALHP